MMRRAFLLGALVGLVFASGASAQMASLTYGEDYTVSQEVHSVTTIKVAPNRIDHYLAGLEQTWVPSLQISEEMGLSKGHAIYVSELPSSGDFNIVLVVVFENAAQREKGNDPALAAELERRVEEKLSEEKGFELTEGYAQIREIVGEHLLREITLK
jgi:hypothetical protein